MVTWAFEICSRSAAAQKLARQHSYTHLVTIGQAPVEGAHTVPNVLHLDMADLVGTTKWGRFRPPSVDDVALLRTFAASLEASNRVLIHCERGVSRSTAAAYVMLAEHVDESEAMNLVRKVRPQARPNTQLVRLSKEAAVNMVDEQPDDTDTYNPGEMATQDVEFPAGELNQNLDSADPYATDRRIEGAYPPVPSLGTRLATPEVASNASDYSTSRNDRRRQSDSAHTRLSGAVLNSRDRPPSLGRPALRDPGVDRSRPDNLSDLSRSGGRSHFQNVKRNELVKALRTLGFAQVPGGKGSHTKHQHSDGRTTIIEGGSPVDPNLIVGDIIKQMGVTEAQLLKALGRRVPKSVELTTDEPKALDPIMSMSGEEFIMSEPQGYSYRQWLDSGDIAGLDAQTGDTLLTDAFFDLDPAGREQALMRARPVHKSGMATAALPEGWRIDVRESVDEECADCTEDEALRVVVDLKDESDKVQGTAWAVRTEPGRWRMDHSMVMPELRGKGFGNLVYRKLLYEVSSRGGALSPDPRGTTDAARNVWRSLNQQPDVQTQGDPDTDFFGQELRLETDPLAAEHTASEGGHNLLDLTHNPGKPGRMSPYKDWAETSTNWDAWEDPMDKMGAYAGQKFKVLQPLTVRYELYHPKHRSGPATSPYYTEPTREWSPGDVVEYVQDVDESEDYPAEMEWYLAKPEEPNFRLYLDSVTDEPDPEHFAPVGDMPSMMETQRTAPEPEPSMQISHERDGVALIDDSNEFGNDWVDPLERRQDWSIPRGNK